MAEPSERKRIYINALPEYEMKLLSALSFFLGRKVSTQAAAALAMYIRQSHDRILSQVEFYAHKAGMNKWDLLNLISDNPQRAEELLKETGEKIHTNEPDIFSEEDA
ncbi:hypothetical protein ACN4EK_20440 [Pantanalinema rosaneae CENA516]|uniref:hypothetical protein n=1 Tax=Pantanalinema rosaneae TaxID=1620701 RepID=UPI003D6EC75A